MGTSFNKDIRLILHLIDTLIKPILLNVSDFWGCMKLPKNNPIENLHQMACKHIIGVQKQTSKIAVLLELGRVPINAHTVKTAVKNENE